jgi:hypothetical protein
MPCVSDTNSIAALSRYYPKQFPTFWDLFHAAVDAEEVISVREVSKELDNHTLLQPWLAEWIKQHKAMFRIPSAEEMQFVGEIFKVKPFQALVGEKQRLRGSPVATASSESSCFLLWVCQHRFGNERSADEEHNLDVVTNLAKAK